MAIEDLKTPKNIVLPTPENIQNPEIKKVFNKVFSEQDLTHKKTFEDLKSLWRILAGLDAMANALNMGSNLINNVTDPVSDQDAATKKYVTDYVAANVHGHQSSQVVGTTSNPTTTSTSLTDLEEMSITLTTGANPVFLSFSGTLQNDTAGQYVGVAFEIDDSSEAESERLFTVAGNNYNVAIATQHLETMTAAQHTFKIQWVVSAGTGKSVVTKRTLSATEQK